jgi:hypothetical protein
MITELFVEGQRVDLSTELSALLTFAVDDVKEFGSRNTNFSKTIVLPGTARNNKVFGNVFELQGASPYNPTLPNVLTNYNAAKSAEAVLFQGNVQVFKGVLRILEIIIDKKSVEYEVAIFGELGGLISELGNKKLEDINFTPYLSEYELEYSIDNITDSWDTINGTGFYWPLIDYGNYSVNKKDWDFKTFRPALYVKDYIDKIFTNTSYTYDCALFNTSRFKSLIVPHNQKQLTKLNNSLATFTGIGAQDLLAFPQQIKFTTASTFFTGNVLGTDFAYSGPTVGFRIRLNLTGTGEGINYGIRFQKAGAITTTQEIIYAGAPGAFSLDLSYNNYFPGVLETGDSISVSIFTDDAYSSSSPVLDLTSASMSLEVDAALQVPLVLGDTISMADIVPRGVLQKDFFSSILKLFNLYVTEDRFESRKLHITPYVDFYHLDSYLDWTYKMDRGRPIRVKPMSELNSRYYEFNFKSDSDYWNEQYQKRYNETYGSRLYDSEFEFANESSELELIFAGTPLVGYLGEDKIYSTILKKNNTTEEQIDSVIRILQAKKIAGVDSWDIMDGATVLESLTDYGYAGHLNDPDAPTNDINFGVPKELFFTLTTGALNVNQFNVYYSPYMAEITDKDSKLLISHFYLTARDIMELDFARLIYIDGAIYRINKIEDYNASNPDTCKVELLKVTNTLYTGSYGAGDLDDSLPFILGG